MQAEFEEFGLAQAERCTSQPSEQTHPASRSLTRHAASRVLQARYVLRDTLWGSGNRRQSLVSERATRPPRGVSHTGVRVARQALVARADVLITDARVQTDVRGEFQHALKQGLVSMDAIAEIGEVLSGTGSAATARAPKPARRSRTAPRARVLPRTTTITRNTPHTPHHRPHQ